MSETAHVGGTFAARPVEWDVFRREVEDLYREPLRRPKTLRKVRQVLRELGAYCTSTADLGPVAVSRWLAGRPGRSPATRRALLATLRAACAFAEHQGYARSPFRLRGLGAWLAADERDGDDDDGPFGRHRSAEEIRRVLERADLEASAGSWHAGRLRAAVYLWAYTGAGLMEVLGLRVCDVDLAAGEIRVRSHPRRRLKTGARAARLPIAPPLRAVLEGWIPRAGCEWLIPGTRREGPWVQGAPGYRPTDRVRQLGERAGVAGLTVLAFRHSFATLSEDWGIGETMLQRILRHSRPRTQRHYRHHDAELLARAAAKVAF